ncbi:MAG: hypothetical protein K9N10_11805 [Deltaproteobacteria bacterium]|nr:hypothetical protein [Deltaproteobacteria bacterium]
MVGSIGNNVAALKALGTKMDVTARNIANANSDEYKKSRAILKEDPNGGVDAHVERIDTPGPSIVSVENGQKSERELSNVDLTEEMTEMIVTQHSYTANLKSIETEDEMLGAALDIVG